MVSTNKSKHIGRIVGLWRYPVKSMGAEALEEVDVSWFGLTGDRRWAFVRNEAESNNFPWLTIRERNDINHYLPSFVDPSRPDKSATTVRTPSGNIMDVTDARLSAELYSRGTYLIRQNRGIFDTFPASLITTQTIAKLGETVGTALDVQRFRPNFLVETNDEMPFAEDEWVGYTLSIGKLRMHVDKRDGRCAVITVDPLTSVRNPKILRKFAQEREGCLGVYGTTVEPGKVALNDSVTIESISD